MSAEADSGGGAFSARTVAVVIAVGLFAFAAYFVLSAFAPDLRRGNNGGAHALSKSAVGYAGLMRLLEARGDTAAVARNPSEGAGAALLVATPGPVPTGKLRDALDDYVNRHEEPILVVLPKWETEPHRNRQGWVSKDGLINPQVAVSPMLIFDDLSVAMVRRAGPADVRLQGRGGSQGAGRIEAFQVLRFTPPPSGGPPGQVDAAPLVVPDHEPVLTDGNGGVVLAYVPSRKTYVLSDPDLLNTQGLAELATARTALAIVDRARRGEGPIMFDVSLHGLAGGRSLLKLAFSPPFLAATLCAAVAAGLAGWQAAVRFGPRARARRSVALGAQALTDNAAMLIRLSGREHRMADRYAELTETAVARAVGAPAGARGAGYLDGLTRKAPGRPAWSALRSQAGAVRTRAALVAAARRMHGWKREVAGGS